MMTSRSLFVCLFGLSGCFAICNAAALGGEEIQGGDYAKPDQFKYQVALQVKGQSFCGGSIIGDEHVLTAAHCVVNEDGKFFRLPMTVLVGTSDLSKKKAPAVIVDVEKIYIPSKYDMDNHYGDIAVLKLRKSLEVESNPKLSKLNLPAPKESYDGEKAVVSGFGWNWAVIFLTKNVEPIEIGGSANTKLKFAETTIADKKQCETMYRHQIFSSQICAKVKQHKNSKSEGVCSGDSGGPLVHSEDTVIGVVSTSPIGCTERLVPAIYTRVSSWLDFIDKAVNDEKSKDIDTYSFFEPNKSESESKSWWSKWWPFSWP